MPIAQRGVPIIAKEAVSPPRPFVPRPMNKVGFGAKTLRKAATTVELERSTLKVVDIPIDMLVDSPDNPNEQDEATFDQLVQGIREDGFDEPVHVVPIAEGEDAGKFMIVSGHHRVKAARVIGMKAVPAILKPGWTGDRRQIELVRRNSLRGDMNPAKFTYLFNELIKRGKDKNVLRQQMGLVKDDLFKRLYKQVEGSLSPIQKKKLVEAKDKINSVDSFSAVLNDIFKNHGTELDYGLLCFKYGDGKKQNVWYVKVDADLNKRLKDLQDEIQRKGLHAEDVFKHLLKNADLSNVQKSAKVAEAIEARNKK